MSQSKHWATGGKSQKQCLDGRARELSGTMPLTGSERRAEWRCRTTAIWWLTAKTHALLAVKLNTGVAEDIAIIRVSKIHTSTKLLAA